MCYVSEKKMQLAIIASPITTHNVEASTDATIADVMTQVKVRVYH